MESSFVAILRGDEEVEQNRGEEEGEEKESLESIGEEEGEGAA
jgi:hypothetical protein